MTKVKTNTTEGVSTETNSKYYQIHIWEDEEMRNEGIPFKIQPNIKKFWRDSLMNSLLNLDVEIMEYPKNWDFNSIDEIKSFVIDTYNSKIKELSGSIEIIEVDVNGSWIKSLYHISVDSNHTLEVV